jgi:hypothetical protein
MLPDDYIDLNPTNLDRHIISLPVAAHTADFHWQLSLFWFAHRRVYGTEAAAKAHAIVIRRNDFWTPPVPAMEWNIDIPHTMCDAYFDVPSPAGTSLMHMKMILAVPLNIQLGLAQVLSKFDDNQILEVIDCDMLHFRPCPVENVGPDELVTSAVYEDWHLFSLTKNRPVIEPYFENSGRYYNGGFVPIIGRVATFKRILREWIAVHIHILTGKHSESIQWWAGMFALQAACEKARVQMISRDYCYIPGINELTDTQYIGHYCVDGRFNKRTYPQVDITQFLDNPYFRLIREWLESSP